MHLEFVEERLIVAKMLTLLLLLRLSFEQLLRHCCCSFLVVRLPDDSVVHQVLWKQARRRWQTDLAVFVHGFYR